MNFFQIMSKVLNVSLIYASFRAATPIIFAALCASVTQQANILNIGTEGIMLTGAFTAVTVSYFTQNWILGILCAMLVGVLMAMIMAVGSIRFGADICGIGMGINMLALAITKFLLKAIFDVNGAFAGTMDRPIVPIPKVHLGFMDKIPFLNSLFNNWSLTEWFVIILIIVLHFFIFKTVWGLRLRAVGQFPEAAKTAGMIANPARMANIRSETAVPRPAAKRFSFLLI